MIYSYLHDDATVSWLWYSYRGSAYTLKSSKARWWLRYLHLDPLPASKISTVCLKVSIPPLLDVHPQLREEYTQTDPGAASATFDLVASETNWMPHDDYNSNIATTSPRLLRHIREATLSIRVDAPFDRLSETRVPWNHITALAESLVSQAPNLSVVKVILHQHRHHSLKVGDLKYLPGETRQDFFITPPPTIADLAHRGTGDGYVFSYNGIEFDPWYVWPAGSRLPPWHRATMVAIHSFSREAVGDEYLPRNNLKLGLFPVVEYPQDVCNFLVEDERELVRMGPMWIYKWQVRGGDTPNELE
jgi:hypothetical protein